MRTGTCSSTSIFIPLLACTSTRSSTRLQPGKKIVDSWAESYNILCRVSEALLTFTRTASSPASSLGQRKDNDMKMINSDIEVLSVGIGSTFDPDNGKYESGILVVVLRDEKGTSVSVKLECNVNELRAKFRHERTYQKMLALFKGDRQALTKAIKKELNK